MTFARLFIVGFKAKNKMIKFLTSTLKKAKQFKSSSIDARLNRQLVGYDRSGNTYYQYYNEKGEESKRFVEPGPNTVIGQTYDAYWDMWLRGMQDKAYSPEELEVLWKEEDNRKKAAWSYEEEDADLMNKHRATKKYQEQLRSSTSEKGQSMDFVPGLWKPNHKK